MAIEVQLNSWHEFCDRLRSYSELSMVRRKQLIFRGQANSEWKLLTTLDRECFFDTSEARDHCIDSLVREFRRESMGLRARGEAPHGELEWELLGRHHGLKTPILDWTESPFIAAFFAFSDPQASEADSVTIWALDRDQFREGGQEEERTPEIRIIDDEEAVRFNHRAVEQRGLFLRVNSTATPVEQILGNALTRFDIPASERQAALADLDEMVVNARVLFRDLDGAARSANQRRLILEDA